MAALALAAALGMWAASRPERLNIHTLPDGVTGHMVGGRFVYVAKQGTEVWALLPYAQHMGRELVSWCPDEQIFAAPTHGEMFDIRGSWVTGPGVRDMDRVHVEVAPDGDVLIDPDRVRLGDPAPAGGGPIVGFPRCSGGVGPPGRTTVGGVVRTVVDSLTQ